ncbi:MAG: hypothetical protein KJ574_02640 [Nanoarchaeota archaeon]|nr:hypothetical protein [Nanoarchaeota archaeon]
MATIAVGIAQFMVDVGLLDVILPFMFVFTIVFAMLQKTKVFGTYGKEPKRNINAMVAFIVAFFFIASLARVQILTSIVQKLALVVVAIICVLLLTGFWGKEVGFLKFKWVYALLFVVVLIIFATSLGWIDLGDLGVIGKWVFHPITAMAVAFILIFWLIIKEPGKKEKREERPKERREGKAERPSEARPGLVKEIPGEELQGGEDRTLWKE